MDVVRVVQSMSPLSIFKLLIPQALKHHHTISSDMVPDLSSFRGCSIHSFQKEVFQIASFKFFISDQCSTLPQSNLAQRRCRCISIVSTQCFFFGWWSFNLQLGSVSTSRYFYYRIIPVFNGVLPDDHRKPVLIFGLAPTHRDFFRLSESSENIIYCRWLDFLSFNNFTPEPLFWNCCRCSFFTYDEPPSIFTSERLSL